MSRTTASTSTARGARARGRTRGLPSAKSSTSASRCWACFMVLTQGGLEASGTARATASSTWAPACPASDPCLGPSSTTRPTRGRWVEPGMRPAARDGGPRRLTPTTATRTETETVTRRRSARKTRRRRTGARSRTPHPRCGWACPRSWAARSRSRAWAARWARSATRTPEGWPAAPGVAVACKPRPRARRRSGTPLTRARG
mmetsp:Transcript_93489/g.241613  ORF Transcript_93489/g.241613 Transcript_93489/m.241613 type:complete len:202 (-) Transcript_93489:302-907(-)